jgi:hypothetical protein
MNNLQLVYIILGVLNLIATALYSLLALPYLTALVKSIFKLIGKMIAFIFCFRLCCHKNGVSKFQKKKSKSSISRRYDSMSMKFTRLSENFRDDDSSENEAETEILHREHRHLKYRIEESDDLIIENEYLTKKNYFKSSSFWLTFALFFVHGSLFINFILFMNSYLISRLSRSNFYQIEIINKLFFFTLIVGRLLTLAYLSLVNRKNTNNTETNLPNKKIFSVLLNRNHVLLCLFLIILFVTSIIQMSSSHFSLNLKLLLFNFNSGQSSTMTTARTISLYSTQIPTTTTTTMASTILSNDVRFSFNTMGVYGVLYPFLLSSLVPQLVNLIECNKFLMYNLRPNSLINFIWSAIIIGFCAQSLLNNYFIYLFKTPNFFIYTNIFTSSLLILFLVCYSNVANRN